MGKIFEALQKSKKDVPESGLPGEKKHEDSAADVKPMDAESQVNSGISGIKVDQNSGEANGIDLATIHSALNKREASETEKQDTYESTNAKSPASEIAQISQENHPTESEAETVAHQEEDSANVPPVVQNVANDSEAIVESASASTPAVQDEQAQPSIPEHYASSFAAEEYSYTDVNKSIITLLKPRSYEAEQFKNLRTNILFASNRKRPKSILITSTEPEEGKSFIASNLAVSIAQNINEHVLLIDSDLRNPNIHKYFGFNDVPGLSEYLSDEIMLPSLLLKTNIYKLSILPSGKPPLNPAELLSSIKMKTLLDEVTSRYPDRLIIIDAAPPQFTSETKALARQVDGILLVIGQGSTKKTNIVETIEMLGKDKILGAVMNKFDTESFKRFKRSKNNRYYRYYEQHKDKRAAS